VAGKPKDRTYSETEIAGRLKRDLPSWRHADGALKRRYATHGWKGTLMLVNAIGHLCEAAWHHPDLAVSFNAVEVSLWTHDAGGITDKDFELARKIEDVIAWRPGAAGGALEGTPSDPRHAYIKYD
jgi:4a-hydroxytetrahydrobiopterin dehydratase